VIEPIFQNAPFLGTKDLEPSASECRLIDEGTWSSSTTILRWKTITHRKARRLVPYLVWLIDQLKSSRFPALVQLGKTLWSWREEIARMLRFTKTNAITEGFHTKMEMISRRAYGFKNFENYRLRVGVLCG
jgi:transposase